jgi:phospholipase/lecithinase/hemolysin
MPVGNLVIFGDSLVDTGNLSLATGETLPNPAVYYYQGLFGRFSGGPIWVDTLARNLGEPAVVPSLAGGLDYGFGGATVASPYGTPGIPSVAEQVGQYLTGAGLADNTGHTPAANDVFAFWAGANDFFDTLASAPQLVNPIQLPGLAATTADTLVSSLGTLNVYGAKNFLVNNLPPLGETPFIQSFQSPELDALANLWTSAFNSELSTDLSQFQSSHAGTTVVAVDINSLFQQATGPNDPYGFVNTTNAVGPLIPGVAEISAITAPNYQNYLFFDGVHPSAKAHQLIGQLATVDLFNAGLTHAANLPTGVSVAGSDLYIVEGDSPGSIQITPDGSSGLEVNGIPVNSGGTLTDIHIFLGNGNDQVSISGGVSVPAVIQEGTGTNTDLLGNGDNTVVITPNSTSGGTFLAGNGNNTFSLGQGWNTVVAGNGNNAVTLGNGSVILGNGINTVVATGTGHDSVVLGNGNDSVTLAASGSVILGNGNDNVAINGSGHGSVIAGNGDDSVNVTGSGGASVILGNGIDAVIGADGNYSVILGNGGDTVDLGNGNSVVYVGTGHNSIALGDGYNVVFGNSDDVISILPGGYTILNLRKRS